MTKWGSTRSERSRSAEVAKSCEDLLKSERMFAVLGTFKLLVWNVQSIWNPSKR